MDHYYKLSACTFIRNTFEGAFCLFESMATFLPFVDEMIVLDLGSTDGTVEYLRRFADQNPKLTLHEGKFSVVDARAFADAANRCISYAKYPTVLFWQADEIWHEKLLMRMVDMLNNGHTNLAFWRYQLQYNFQEMKWFPHPVHRIMPRDEANFVNDGMNTQQVFGARMCSEYDMGWFTKWGTMDPMEIPVWDMIMDVSQTGGFRDNIVQRRRLHAPMWHEEPTIEGIQADEWYRRACADERWTRNTSPFDIPNIMKFHVGRVKYDFRTGNLYQALVGYEKHSYELIGLETS